VQDFMQSPFDIRFGQCSRVKSLGWDYQGTVNQSISRPKKKEEFAP
jgi:hypothetical protein